MLVKDSRIYWISGRMSGKNKISIWRQLHPWSVLRRTIRAFQDNQLHARCAQFAYYSILGLAPLLMVVISVIAKLSLKGTMTAFYSLLERVLPNEAYEMVTSQIASIETATTTNLIITNLFIFCFAGARLFLTISESMNSAFGLPPRHKRIRMFGMSSIMPLVFALLLLLGLLLVMAAPTALNWMIHILEIEQFQSILLQTARWLIVLGGLFIFTATLYCVVPATKVPWRLFTPGNVFAVAGWIIASQCFRLYVDNFGRYDVTYGALGGVIVLLLWLYLLAAFLFIGGQINGVIFRQLNEEAKAALSAEIAEASKKPDTDPDTDTDTDTD